MKHINIRQKLLLFSFIIVTWILLIGFAVYKSDQKFIATAEAVRHTENIIYQSDHILSHGVEIQTAARGFILTNDSDLLEPLVSSLDEVYGHIAQLKRLTANMPDEQKYVDSLDYYMHERINYTDYLLTVFQKHGLTSAINIIKNNEGKQITDRMRHITHDFEQLERSQLEKQEAENAHSIAMFNLFTLVMSALMTLITIFLFVLRTNYLHQHEKDMVQLAVSNAELKTESETRKKSEELVRESERLYHSLFHNMLNGLAYCQMHYDDDGHPSDFTYLSVNDAFTIQTGLKNVEGKLVTEIIPDIKDTDKQLLTIYGRVAETGKSERFEIYVEALSMWFWVSVYSPQKGYFVSLFDVITERKNAERLIIESEKKFRAVIQTANDAIVLSDGSGNIIFWNQFAEALFGYKENEALGKSLTLIMPERFREAHNHGIRRLSGEGARDQVIGKTVEYTGIKRDGAEFPIELSISTWQIENDKFYCGVIRDITERKKSELTVKNINIELEKRVNERTVQLTEANKALEAFSYSASHDLRAPVRAVMGFTKIINQDYREKMDPELCEMFGYIESNSRRMNSIIEDLLVLAKYDKGKLKYEQVDMTKLVRNIWSHLEIAESHKAILQLEDIPVVQADLSMIEQIIINLLSNAVKYSSKKENPQVKVGCEKSDGGHTFYIKDNGAGFDMNHYDSLFGAFKRLHSANEFEGTGVGLTIVKRIIEKHGGKVWAEGKVNEGATFYFTIPEAINGETTLTGNKQIPHHE